MFRRPARFRWAARHSWGPRSICACAAFILVATIHADLALAQDLAGLTPDPQFDLPNPAALYCHMLGYRHEIVQTEDGARDICILPDGTRVDAWSFFRGECAQPYSHNARGGGSASDSAAVAACTRGGNISSSDWLGLFADEINEGRGSGDESEYVHVAESTLPSGELHPPVLPPRFDWRELDGCTPVRSQGACGSCWAFATTAVMESAILIHDGVAQDLSEQWLISCNGDAWDCDGGSVAHNYFLYKQDPCSKSGTVLEEEFPYGEEDLPCECPYQHDYWLNDWGVVGTLTSVPPVALMKQAIYDHGPICVKLATDDDFASYSGGVFSDCNATGVNHMAVLVGWDDMQGSEGVWFLRNSWGTGWGEDGYMRIEYGCNRVGYGATWVDYPGTEKLGIVFTHPIPEALEPDEPTSFKFALVELNDDYIAGSGRVFYRLDGGEQHAAVLSPLASGLYSFALPALPCGTSAEYYVMVEGERWGPGFSPADAPNTTYSSVAGEMGIVFADDFETDTGWTVVNDPNLSAGAWERGEPVGNGQFGDPVTDYDGSGCCYVTGNAPGNSDVDRGMTWLISPPFDLSGYDHAKVEYALWYTNRTGNDPFNDVFRTYVSGNDGADWVEVDAIGPHSEFGWQEHNFMIEDFVPLSDRLRVRFEASDLNNSSTVEAGIDAFKVLRFDCPPSSAEPPGPAMAQLILYPGQPNPFTAETCIQYELPRSTPVCLIVLDASGRVQRTLVKPGKQAAGPQRAIWDGRDERGRHVPAGIYYCRLSAGSESLLEKLIVVE